MAKYPISPDELFTVEEMPEETLAIKVDIDPGAVKTCLPPNLMPLPERKKNAVFSFSNLTLEYLLAAYKDLFRRKPESKKKADLIGEMAEALCFSGLQQFNAWFAGLHPLTRVILARIVFEEDIPVKTLEAEYGLTLLEKTKTNGWAAAVMFLKELRLNFLPVYKYCDHFIVRIPAAFRQVLAPWFVPPQE
ncbi:MAG: hypothetical protein LBJ24_04255, partial [Treponema sp.]|nr:hypothetical protein [Treponema sp.]